MLTEKGAMHTEVIFNKDKSERFLLRKVWDESKPIVCLIMTNPSSANVVEIDMTVHYAISNLYKLDYGGMEILNMTSAITTKLDTSKKLTLSDENAEYIIASAGKADKVILAWGKLGENNKRVSLLQMKLLKKLAPFTDKLFVIASESGAFGFHPLAPQIRFHWELIPFICPPYLQEKKEEAAPADRPSEPSDGEFNAPLPGELWKQSKGKKKDTSEVKPA